MSVIRAQVTEIVNELRDARLGLDVSQQTIAEAVGVSRGQVGHWETGKQEPSVEHLERWAAHFGWSLRIHLERQPGQAPEPAEDFATVVGRLAIIWKSLPDSARRGIAELVRAFGSMAERN